MAKQQSKTLLNLYTNLVLRAQVEEALDTEVKYDDIIEMAKEAGLELNKTALSRYKQKREQAKEEGVPTGALIAGTTEWSEYLSKRIDNKKDEELIKKQEEEIAEEQRVEASREDAQKLAQQDYELPKEFTQTLVEDVSDQVGPRNLYNDVEVLDEIITKGMETVKQQDGVDPKVLLKAIEIKGKLTDGNLKGMSIQGIKALEARQKRLSYVLTDVLMKYVPEEKRESATEDLERAEAIFNQSLNQDDSYRALKSALEAGGVSIDRV